MISAEVFGGFNGGGGRSGATGILAGTRFIDDLFRLQVQHGIDDAPIVFVAHPVHSLLTRALGHKPVVAAVVGKVGGTDNFNR